LGYFWLPSSRLEVRKQEDFSLRKSRHENFTFRRKTNKHPDLNKKIFSKSNSSQMALFNRLRSLKYKNKTGKPEKEAPWYTEQKPIK